MAIASDTQAQLDRLSAVGAELDAYVAAQVKAANDQATASAAQLATVQASLDAATAAATQVASDHADEVAALKAQIDALDAKLAPAS